MMERLLHILLKRLEFQVASFCTEETIFTGSLELHLRNLFPKMVLLTFAAKTPRIPAIHHAIAVGKSPQT